LTTREPRVAFRHRGEAEATPQQAAWRANAHAIAPKIQIPLSGQSI